VCLRRRLSTRHHYVQPPADLQARQDAFDEMLKILKIILTYLQELLPADV
jgi:hypothetical protein